jgi:hypothetical protein
MLINNGNLELTPGNTYIVMYPNDILDGILVDDDENYAFISAHTPGYDGLADQLETEGVEVFSVEGDIDLSEPPHCWVVQSVGKLIVHDSEELIEN